MSGNRTYFCVCEYDPTRCLKWENVHSPYMERDFFSPLNPSVLSPAVLTQFDLPGALQAGLGSRNTQWAFFFSWQKRGVTCSALQPSRIWAWKWGMLLPACRAAKCRYLGAARCCFSWNCASLVPPGWELPPPAVLVALLQPPGCAGSRGRWKELGCVTAR